MTCVPTNTGDVPRSVVGPMQHYVCCHDDGDGKLLFVFLDLSFLMCKMRRKGSVLTIVSLIPHNPSALDILQSASICGSSLGNTH